MRFHRSGDKAAKMAAGLDVVRPFRPASKWICEGAAHSLLAWVGTRLAIRRGLEESGFMVDAQSS